MMMLLPMMLMMATAGDASEVPLCRINTDALAHAHASIHTDRQCHTLCRRLHTWWKERVRSKTTCTDGLLSSAALQSSLEGLISTHTHTHTHTCTHAHTQETTKAKERTLSAQQPQYAQAELPLSQLALARALLRNRPHAHLPRVSAVISEQRAML